jgi:hypothetical protein
MPKSKENSVSSAAEMDVVAEAVEARMAGKTLSLAAVKGIYKKPRRQQINPRACESVKMMSLLAKKWSAYQIEFTE